MNNKKYEKAEIIIKKFSTQEVILASGDSAPDYTPGDNDTEILPQG